MMDANTGRVSVSQHVSENMSDADWTEVGFVWTTYAAINSRVGLQQESIGLHHGLQQPVRNRRNREDQHKFQLGTEEVDLKVSEH